jgi:hypothetical protein
MLLPTKAIQEAYINGYKLKKYLPIIMHPHMIEAGKDSKSYYSLQFPTMPNSPMEIEYSSSTIKEMEELYELIQLFQEIQNRIESRVHDGSYDYVKSIENVFYHSRNDDTFIKDTKELPTTDAEFLKLMIDGIEDFEFPSTSLFINGCIQINAKFEH